MNRKSWLIIFLLVSLILLLGGVRRPGHHDGAADDPLVRSAEAVVSRAALGSQEEWRGVARTNPQWILRIESISE